jgi:hypothetical protein
LSKQVPVLLPPSTGASLGYSRSTHALREQYPTTRGVGPGSSIVPDFSSALYIVLPTPLSFLCSSLSVSSSHCLCLARKPLRSTASTAWRVPPLSPLPYSRALVQPLGTRRSSSASTDASTRRARRARDARARAVRGSRDGRHGAHDRRRFPELPLPAPAAALAAPFALCRATCRAACCGVTKVPRVRTMSSTWTFAWYLP